MIVSVKVLNHVSMMLLAMQYRIPGNAYVISISNPGEDPIFPEDTDMILNMQFDDVDPSFIRKTGMFTKVEGNLQAITELQADKIIKHLWKAHSWWEYCTVYVNCAAGIARSGAVGTVAHRMAGIPYEEFRKENPLVQPNGYILQQLTRAWRRWEERL